MLIRPPLHNVVAISLEWNNIGLLDQGVEALAGVLEVDKRLLILDLRNNNIGPEGAKALAKALRVNRTLRQLELRWNEVGNPGVLAFREALQSNHSLVTLELMGNVVKRIRFQRFISEISLEKAIPLAELRRAGARDGSVCDAEATHGIEET